VHFLVPSKINLNQGYHQIPLHSDSRSLIMFSTHASISHAAEIFQRKVSDAICGIPCIKNTSDDIYVGDRDNDTHDLHLCHTNSMSRGYQLTC